MKNTSCVSVIIPIYNTEKYLRDCLDCIVNQTLHNIEIICVDDGSTDSSILILQEYAARDDRIIVLQQKNKGAGAARNFGLEHASGEYLIFLDSDDLFEKDLLEKTVTKARSEQADIVAFDFDLFYPDMKVENKVGINLKRLPLDVTSFNYKMCPNGIMSIINPVPWDKLYRTNFVLDKGLRFDEISSTNDITFSSVTVASAERISFIKERLVHYRVGHGDTTTEKKAKNLNNISIAVESAIRQALALPYSSVIMNSIKEFAIGKYIFALDNYTAGYLTQNAIDFYDSVHDRFSEPFFNDVDGNTITNESILYKFRLVKAHTYGELQNLSKRKIIASLTTFPGRINGIVPVIETILNQTKPVDEVILWLAKEQFPNGNDDFPDDLMQLISGGKVTVSWTNRDLKPHKKYLYSFMKYPDSLIVTFDDDLLYSPQLVENLFNTHLLYPNAVCASRVHIITKNDDGKIDSYSNWIKESDSIYMVPNMQLIATGGAGTLYPPLDYPKNMLDEDVIAETCPMADDLWLKAMEVVANIPVVLGQHFAKLQYVENSQNQTLWHSNVIGNENDSQYANIVTWLDKNVGTDLFEQSLSKFGLSNRELIAALDQERKEWRKKYNAQERQIKKLNKKLEKQNKVISKIKASKLYQIKMHVLKYLKKRNVK